MKYLLIYKINLFLEFLDYSLIRIINKFNLDLYE